jgi:hypothetical protein
VRRGCSSSVCKRFLQTNRRFLEKPRTHREKIANDRARALTGMAFRGAPRVLLPSRDFLICIPSARLARDGSRYVVANRQAPARPGQGAHTVTAVLIPATAEIPMAQ